MYIVYVVSLVVFQAIYQHRFPTDAFGNLTGRFIIELQNTSLWLIARPYAVSKEIHCMITNERF